MTNKNANLIVLSSGTENPDSESGKTLEALSNATLDGTLNARIAVVASQFQHGRTAYLAHKLGIPFFWIEDPKDEECYEDLWERSEHQLRVLAGYDCLVPNPDTNTVNIHPALLPDCGGPGWYGDGVHYRVAFKIRSGELNEYGLTIHFAGEEIDSGPVIFQQRYKVSSDLQGIITAAYLKETIKAQEQYWYPRIIDLILRENIRWDGRHNHSLILPEGYQPVHRCAD